MVACPACGDALPHGDVVQCGCGQWFRIDELPERPCSACGQSIVMDRDAARCGTCGQLQAADPDRTLRVVATCPRCRRRIDVDADADQGACPHCGQEFHLRDTL